MNCEQANQIDVVEYLNSLGYKPQKIRGSDYWYSSPFRNEKEASFKINRNKNVWYDHGAGKGGKLVDFVTELHRCDVRGALEIISSFHPQNNITNKPSTSQLHLHKNSLIVNKDARETAIKIIAAKQPIQDLVLCRYLWQRRIDKSIADRYCREVHFTNVDKQKIYKAIGFKNNAGGYDLRNEYFKGSSSPKYITHVDNKAKNVSVFEGFFDFMSYETLNKNQREDVAALPSQHMNFLILNSLSFFERSLHLMEQHENIHLFLDHDNAGRKCTSLALKRSLHFNDESKLYKGYKDLNDWMMNFGKLEKKMRQKKGKRL